MVGIIGLLPAATALWAAGHSLLKKENSLNNQD